MRHFFIFLFFVTFFPNDSIAITNNIEIMATIKPIHSLVSNVTDGINSPKLLIDGSVSIHDYILKPSDAKKIMSSQIIFYVSDDLETFVHTIKNKTLIELINQTDLLPLRNSFIFDIQHKSKTKVKDVHIWLDPNNSKKIVKYVSSILSNIDPSNAKIYERNADNTIKRIDALIINIQDILKYVKGQPYIVGHDAYQYFEKYFGLNSVAALSLGDEAMISIKSLIKLKNIVRESKIQCVFSEFNDDMANKLLDKSIKIVELDPVGTKINSGKDAYFTMMINIANNIKKCFTNM